MTHNLEVQRYLDANNEHRARIVAGNGEAVFVSNQGYQLEMDLIISQELTRQALNDDYHRNPTCADIGVGTPADGLLGAASLGSLAAHTTADSTLLAVFNNPPPPENPLIEARMNALMEVFARPVEK
jgi:uncharacterized protein YegP (UPF0339 family)